MSTRKSREDIFRWSLIGAIVLILLMRIAPVFRVLFATLIILGVAGFTGVAVWYFFNKRRRQQRYAASTEGQIEQRIAFCRGEITKQETDIVDIEENIDDLEAQINSSSEIAPQNRIESELLIRAFRSQLELRRSKMAFYEKVIHKLETLLHNQRLASDLELKKKKLEQLRENNFEELAKLESLRSDVEMETLYLETIDQLSRRIQDTNTVDDAEILQKELEKMTKELEY